MTREYFESVCDNGTVDIVERCTCCGDQGIILQNLQRADVPHKLAELRAATDSRARLISAAPDMLAALQSNLEYLDLKAQGFAKQYPPDHCVNLTVFRQLEQTRAAISKATGE